MATRRSLLLFTFACAGLTCLSQNSASFHWDWNTTQELKAEDRIAQSKTLSAEDRSGLLKALGLEAHHSGTDSQVRVKAIDLGAADYRTFVAQGVGDFSCSPTGNCEFWIIRRKGNAYSVLLHRGAVQTFTVQPTTTKGMHDLVLGMHGSATQQGLKLYHFDGTKYRLVACGDARWSVLDRDGELHDLTEPEITLERCR